MWPGLSSQTGIWNKVTLGSYLSSQSLASLLREMERTIVPTSEAHDQGLRNGSQRDRGPVLPASLSADLAGREVILTGFGGGRRNPEQSRAVSAPSPVQVLPDGPGQAPAHVLAAQDEGAAGEEAGQGLRPAPGGGEGEAPAGEGPAGLGLSRWLLGLSRWPLGLSRWPLEPAWWEGEAHTSARRGG